MYFREFERLSTEYDKAKMEFDTLKEVQADRADFYHWDRLKALSQEIQVKYDGLKTFVNAIDEKRKKSYSKPWGYPREGQANIIFKFLEHGPHGKLFYTIKEELSKGRLKERESETHTAENSCQ